VFDRGDDEEEGGEGGNEDHWGAEAEEDHEVVRVRETGEFEAEEVSAEEGGLNEGADDGENGTDAERHAEGHATAGFGGSSGEGFPEEAEGGGHDGAGEGGLGDDHADFEVVGEGESEGDGDTAEHDAGDGEAEAEVAFEAGDFGGEPGEEDGEGGHGEVETAGEVGGAGIGSEMIAEGGLSDADIEDGCGEVVHPEADGEEDDVLTLLRPGEGAGVGRRTGGRAASGIR